MDTCKVAIRAALEVIKEQCGDDRFYAELGKIIGLSDEDLEELYPFREKCPQVVNTLTEEMCRDVDLQKKWVFCRVVTRLRTKELSEWLNVLDEAWKELREKCKKKGVVV